MRKVDDSFDSSYLEKRNANVLWIALCKFSASEDDGGTTIKKTWIDLIVPSTDGSMSVNLSTTLCTSNAIFCECDV